MLVLGREFPDEIFLEIFWWLTPKELAQTRLVSRKFRSIADTESLWRGCLQWSLGWDSCSSSRYRWQRRFVRSRSLALKKLRQLGTRSVVRICPSFGALNLTPEPRVLTCGGSPHLVGRPLNGGIALWALLSGKRRWAVPLKGVTALATSSMPHTSHIALGGRDGSVQMRDAITGDGLCVLGCAQEAICLVSWYCDGMLAVGGGKGSFSLWDSAGYRHRTWQLGATLQSVIRIDPHQWAVGTVHSVRLLDDRCKGWRVIDDRPQHQIQLELVGSRGSRHLVWRRSGAVFQWDFRSPRVTLMAPWCVYPQATTFTTTVQRDNNCAVIGFCEGTVQLWSVTAGNLSKVCYTDESPVVGVMCLGPEAPHHYAIANEGGKLFVWDSARGKAQSILYNKKGFGNLVPLRIRDMPAALLIGPGGDIETLRFTI